MLREGRLIAVSPCFNDAVVSCAGLLAARPDSTVLTVYSGLPLAPEAGSAADRCSGFKNGRQAVLDRRARNERALSLLGVRGVQMDLLHDAYLESGEEGRLTGALASALSALRPRVVLLPLGLHSAAHVRVSEAGLTLRALFQRVEWIAYEEVADAEPGAVQERLADLLGRRILASPLDVGTEVDVFAARQRALAARGSLALDPPDAAPGKAPGTAPGALASRPERYWRLSWRREKG
ncbi:hypothetical protein [Achromobacter sp. Root565]|uniref:hypothetical protein n=1 Tax=Achromobacter sp. Root565 TaxID=1736564 RepID=UPI000701DD7A|nr:hypothetical protein [Achromobacter sp. Root565]KRA01677.1 hypothetical protein ASD71_06275 [Achromobacter sp. Root565]